jgi:hypothetical protein
MTEQEWLNATDPFPMLAFLEGRASARKLRLFAAACCRRAWHLLPYKRSRRAVETVECYADGAATAKELRSACGAARAVTRRHSSATDPAVGLAVTAVVHAAMPVPGGAAACAGFARRALYMEGSAGPDSEHEAQARLLRELFGPLPFRPVPVAPAWLRWNQGTVRKLAQAVYQAKQFADLPVLADALEEAGCMEDDLLGHLRGPGPHVRGCWALDLALGQEGLRARVLRRPSSVNG